MKLTIEVPDPDPNSMFLREQIAEVASGPWEGTELSTSGASIIVGVHRDGERVGNIRITAEQLLSAVFDALTAEMAGSVEP